MIFGRMASVQLPPEAIKEDELRRLHSYWRRKCGPEGWIRMRDFRAEHLSSVQPHVAVIERFPCEKRRFLIRTAGRTIANVKLGFAPGRYVGELRPAWYRDHILESYAAALRAGVPCYHSVSIQFGDGTFEYRRLTLPMTRDGLACDSILVGTVLSPQLVTFLLREPSFA
jgi:hypothetical protein